MNGAARRAALVLVAYVCVAVLVIAVADWVRPVLALPASFPRLLRGLLALGLPVALLLAWHYPKLGHHGMNPGDDGPAEGRGP